jgi:CheY-like chemotaxis protein
MKGTVLIVDDESNLRRTVAEILRARGYTTLEACDGSQAIELLHASVPNLIFTDWKMPGVGGGTCCASCARIRGWLRSRSS